MWPSFFATDVKVNNSIKVNSDHFNSKSTDKHHIFITVEVSMNIFYLIILFAKVKDREGIRSIEFCNARSIMALWCFRYLLSDVIYFLFS